ncbi:N-terminal phage integrase SAM-like domain-containing protein [Niallia circulans]|uniref:N-terminal phage integrase SAM-like domain-containing protein n=1 Tax=Niallia circulans TaxID=1397 RepID=UPI0021F68A41|nr:N-terminal phage integrase SAM-like domain-containing protein [Niallia circulans]
MGTYGYLCEDTTLITRENYINNQIIPSIGNYKLNKLTRLEYQKHLNSLSEKHAKKQYKPSILFSVLQ